MWRMPEAFEVGQVQEVVTWLCARYLADRSTSVQNIILHLALPPKKM